MNKILPTPYLLKGEKMICPYFDIIRVECRIGCDLCFGEYDNPETCYIYQDEKEKEVAE